MYMYEGVHLLSVAAVNAEYTIREVETALREIQMAANAAGEIQLSRDDERTGESVSIENQREMLGRYVHEQGWDLISTYCDDRGPGTSLSLPQ